MSNKAKSEQTEIEFRPDAWERFERAVDAAVKGGPKHKAGKLRAKANTKPSQGIPSVAGKSKRRSK